MIHFTKNCFLVRAKSFFLTIEKKQLQENQGSKKYKKLKKRKSQEYQKTKEKKRLEKDQKL